MYFIYDIIKRKKERKDFFYMEEEYWTTEHAKRMEENLDDAQLIWDTLEKTQQAHEKGGIYFKTTKRLLETYRSLRFDTVNEKMLKVVESADNFSRAESVDLAVSLDNILSMPEIYAYYSKEIDRFVTSSIPVTMGLFVHVVDAGIKILSFAERKEKEIKYSEILKALYVDEEMNPDELFKKFKTNRSTFYRKKDEAITALSIIIFGPLGNRHPTLLFDDNILKKKYGRFLHMADAMDTICGLAEVTEKYEK